MQPPEESRRVSYLLPTPSGLARPDLIFLFSFWTEFTKDLMIDPSTRDISDIKHTIVAAASSSSAGRAKKFLEECKCPSSAKTYGSYEELVKDKDVDIVYVATPHSHHYQNTMLCLLAGKNVLCEKAFTTNAAQAKKLIETAREKKLFLMEAVWTRFFPLSMKICKLIESGELGSVHRVIADLSFGEDVENVWGTNHRMVNKDLAGGALLDRAFTSIGPRNTHKRSNLTPTSSSRHLFPNLGLPNPLPHPSTSTAQTANCRLTNDPLRPNRRRRINLHPPHISQRPSQPETRHRYRSDKSACRNRPRRQRHRQTSHPYPRHQR